MRITKKILKDTPDELKACAIVIAAPYPELGPHKLIQKAYNYIKKPPNPIRRTLRFGGTVLITPVAIPLATASYAFFFATGIIGGSLCIASSGAALPFAILYDLGVSGYKHLNNFIDLFDETAVPTHPLPEIQEIQLAESHTFILKKLKTNEIPNIQKFTAYTQTYIQSFEQKIPYSEQIKHLRLTDKELLRFEEYLDPINMKIIDIPVKLNDHIYDLSTILRCYKAGHKDPFNNISFKLSHVSSDRSTSEKIQALITTIQQEKILAKNEREFEVSVEDGTKCQM